MTVISEDKEYLKQIIKYIKSPLELQAIVIALDFHLPFGLSYPIENPIENRIALLY